MSLLNPTAASAVRRITVRPSVVHHALRQSLLPIQPHSHTFSTLRPFAPTTRGSLLAKSPSHILCQTRFASAAASTAPDASAPSTPQLDWNTFFQLRKTRRHIQVLFSILGAGTCGTGGSWVLASGLAEPLVSLIPLDPFISMGMMAFASATLGWLLGPIMGSAVFNMWHRRLKPQIAAKEREFFARVKRHRVDPRTSSVGNPVPDFYGEKVSSVSGYRQWLKDQRAYNRKRMTFV
ncbi:related to Presequence translocated-associated motor subunit PAM17, mitochondrial [Cephalotrichum gorgonifer]|uniref:Presequence translocated-associated motor subunit PAM17 n=1 Tax=Cephalotrichum gorgonifer TaxID=2041049 RepID=A0AAE8SQX0_9PEZI|nr:related to Presequence translocated-associated motor subunit PAM17, mitochondrial [Cephalotrichum gorgonifer]